MDYAEYLQSEHWQLVRQEAIKRSKGRCMLCPETRCLEVHHRDYARLGCELPEDLVVLCFWCHRRHHGTFASAKRCTHTLPLPFDPIVPTDSDLN